MKINTLIAAGIASVVLITSTMLVGCSITDDQKGLISQAAGLSASVGWIAKYNPEREAMNLVLETLDVVQTNLSSVASGQKYIEVLHPIITDFVRSDSVPNQYEPLVLAGATAALNGIDILFILYPEWKAQEGLAIGLVSSFIDGAKMGVSLSDNDPRLMEARATAVARARVFNEE